MTMMRMPVFIMEHPRHVAPRGARGTGPHRRTDRCSSPTAGSARRSSIPTHGRRRPAVAARLLVLRSPRGVHADPGGLGHRDRDPRRCSRASRSSATEAWSLSFLLITALSFSVWAHHMFATGAVELPFFSVTTELISIPTGVLFFVWLGHPVEGEAPVRAADAVRPRVHRDVPDRRDRRRVGGVARDGLRDPRHVLGRGAPPLRAVRRHHLRRHGGDVLLVPEDDRADARPGGWASGSSGSSSSGST